MGLTFRPWLPVFPPLLARERTWTWSLMGRTTTGGRTMSGLLTTARFDGGGLWQAKLQDLQVSTPAQIAAWRALANLAAGGAQPLVMECVDPRLWPVPVVSGVPVRPLVRVGNSDGSVVSDGLAYEQPTVDVTLNATAAARQTELGIYLWNCAALRGGERFSIEHQTFGHRLYEVQQVRQSGPAARIRISPPLREATLAGARMEFDRPRCIMQLADPASMDLPMTLRNHGSASPTFIERLPPFADGDALTALAAP